MENKVEKFLPLGSVVTLKNTDKKIMVIGYLISTPSKGQKIFDYMGCLYPEGVIAPDKNIIFDHSDIEQVYAIGYSDDSQKLILDQLKQIDINMHKNIMTDINNIVNKYKVGDNIPGNLNN